MTLSTITSAVQQHCEQHQKVQISKQGNMGPGGEGWGPAFRSFPFGGTEPGDRLDYAVSCEPLTLSRLGTVPQTEQGSSYTDTLLPDT